MGSGCAHGTDFITRWSSRDWACIYMPSRPVLQGQKFWNYMVSKLDAQILLEQESKAYEHRANHKR
jgi:hypothetical protein